MSSSTHVYIVVGSCQDGSVVLVHSSPAGVRLSGTPDTDRENKQRGGAVRLAKGIYEEVLSILVYAAIHPAERE
ncbi:MAG: hypothetical protein ACLVIY_02750 [Anaerobutyricum soehngenii]